MFFIKKWILQIIGKNVSSEIGLVEGAMDSKSWYKSKTLWSVVLNGVVAVIQVVKPELMNTQVATTLIVILTAMGIYGRTSANTTLTK
ncbi:MAG: hypothetical protein PHH73_00075 [Candidatus Rickettsiella isopodorum]|nr:hypothetical protein [Candidatus Rickettsiella isopodorum]